MYDPLIGCNRVGPQTHLVPSPFWSLRNLVPEKFGPQEIWSPKNLVPGKFGPQEEWSPKKIAKYERNPIRIKL